MVEFLDGSVEFLFSPTSTFGDFEPNPNPILVGDVAGVLAKFNADGGESYVLRWKFPDSRRFQDLLVGTLDPGAGVHTLHFQNRIPVIGVHIQEFVFNGEVVLRTSIIVPDPNPPPPTKPQSKSVSIVLSNNGQLANRFGVAINIRTSAGVLALNNKFPLTLDPGQASTSTFTFNPDVVGTHTIVVDLFKDATFAGSPIDTLSQTFNT